MHKRHYNDVLTITDHFLLSYWCVLIGMSADIDAHVTSQYEIIKRIGKGVSTTFTL